MTSPSCGRSIILPSPTAGGARCRQRKHTAHGVSGGSRRRTSLVAGEARVEELVGGSSLAWSRSCGSPWRVFHWRQKPRMWMGGRGKKGSARGRTVKKVVIQQHLTNPYTMSTLASGTLVSRVEPPPFGWTDIILEQIYKYWSI